MAAGVAIRVSGKHRETTVKIFPVAQRALRRVAAAHQRFELVIALFAGVFKQGHEQILARVGAIYLMLVGANLLTRVRAIHVASVGANLPTLSARSWTEAGS